MINKSSLENKKLSAKEKIRDIKDRLIMSIRKLFDMARAKYDKTKKIVLRKDKSSSLKKIKILTRKNITTPILSRSATKKLSLVFVILLFSGFQLLKINKLNNELLALKKEKSANKNKTKEILRQIRGLDKNLKDSLESFNRKLTSIMEDNERLKTKECNSQKQIELNKKGLNEICINNNQLRSHINQMEVKFHSESKQRLDFLNNTYANNKEVAALSVKVATLMQHYNKTNITNRNYTEIGNYQHVIPTASLSDFEETSIESISTRGQDNQRPGAYMKKTSFNNLQGRVSGLEISVKDIENLMKTMYTELNSVRASIINIPLAAEKVHNELFSQIKNIYNTYDPDMKEITGEIFRLNQRFNDLSKSGSSSNPQGSEINSKTGDSIPAETPKMSLGSDSGIGDYDSEYHSVRVVEEEVPTGRNNLPFKNFLTFPGILSGSMNFHPPFMNIIKINSSFGGFTRKPGSFTKQTESKEKSD